MPRNRSEKITPETQMLIRYRKEIVEYIAARKEFSSGEPARSQLYAQVDASRNLLKGPLERLGTGWTWEVILAQVTNELALRGVK